MDILYLLIPLSAGLVLVILGVFGWAVQRGQFDDLEAEGQRLLQLDGEGDATAAAAADTGVGALPAALAGPAVHEGRAPRQRILTPR